MTLLDQLPSLQGIRIGKPRDGWVARPLEAVVLTGIPGGTAVVARDGAGREYFRGAAGADGEVSFTVGGALGTHTVDAGDGTVTFPVDAQTAIADDTGAYRELFDALNRTMRCYGPAGYASLSWRGKTYYNFVSWMLDHCHTAKGMQFFSPHTGSWAELWRDGQRDDGMVWSFCWADKGPGYFDNAYGPYGYARRVDGALFSRQPVENHNEYNFVETIHMHWKGSGDDAWMRSMLASARRALDYSVTDRARFSERFGLLKRGYTIDSWDFQVHDEHTVEFPLATAQNIDPDRTKFGVFHGDNHGYALACDMLAEMLEHAGDAPAADAYRQRARDIHQRLTEIAWNGQFFAHRVEEDPAVKRDLGVDEASQVAMSNCYAVNRGVTREQALAILRFYQEFSRNLPGGSPGEWYAIYPPFGRGFGHDSSKWQYMNAGVHGHPAGELARGAFAWGFERYGVDVLLRLLALARRDDKGYVRFAWTGAYDPPPPPRRFTTVDLSGVATMDLWDNQTAGGDRGWMGGADGNDMRNLPVGRQTLAGVPYDVTDPAKNARRSAIAVGTRGPWPREVEVPVNARAGAVHLLHTVGSLGPSGNAGVVTIRYDDGTEQAVYIQGGKHVAGWWYPELSPSGARPSSGAGDGADEPTVGVAWRGPNLKSNDVGVCFAAVPVRHPDKTIKSLLISATAEGATYAVCAVTLADRPPYQRPPFVSHGGPDNWSGGTTMYALVQGLGGVMDARGATAMRRLRLSPRWAATDAKDVRFTARYPASGGYVAYHYRHDPAARQVRLTLTGSGDDAQLRVLLPDAATGVASTTIDGRPTRATVETVEASRYAVLDSVHMARPIDVVVTYAV